MQIESFYHSPHTKWAYSYDKDTFHLRVRTKKNDVDHVTALTGDKYDMRGHGRRVQAHHGRDRSEGAAVSEAPYRSQRHGPFVGFRRRAGAEFQVPVVEQAVANQRQSHPGSTRYPKRASSSWYASTAGCGSSPT